MRSRRLSGLTAVLTLAATFVLMAPTPASAAPLCATYPGTNEIRIEFGPPLDQFFKDIVVPATPGGLVQVCYGGTGSIDPQTSPPAADAPPGCGVPCFYVSWDGVSNGPVALTVSVTVGSISQSKTVTIPGGSKGGFCVNAGTPCP